MSLSEKQFGPFASRGNEDYVRQSSLPHGIPVRPYLETSAIRWQRSDGSAGSLPLGAEEKDYSYAEVPMDKVVTEQKTVSPERLNDMWHNRTDGYQRGDYGIAAYDLDTDRYLLLEGNHRATVAKHEGQMFLPTRVAGTYHSFDQSDIDDGMGDTGSPGSFTPPKTMRPAAPPVQDIDAALGEMHEKAQQKKIQMHVAANYRQGTLFE